MLTVPKEMAKNRDYDRLTVSSTSVCGWDKSEACDEIFAHYSFDAVIEKSFLLIYIFICISNQANESFMKSITNTLP